MRASVCRAVGKIGIEQLDEPKPGPGEVRLRMVAAGVCRTDLSIYQGHLPVPMPIVLGHEGAGVVEEVGPDVRGLAVGDSVVCSIIAGCGVCFQCLREASSLCEDVTFYTGKMLDGTTRLSRGDEDIHSLAFQGAFAEQAIVPERCAVRVSKDAPLADVAGLACGVATGLGAAMVRAPVEPGEIICVIGAGGVGLSTLMGARLRGAAELIAVDIVPKKLAHAEALGLASTLIDARDGAVSDAILSATHGRGADVVYDAVGSTQTVLQALDGVRAGGRVVIIGIADALVEVPLQTRHLLRQKTVTGTMGGSIQPHRHIPEFVDLHLSGRLDLGQLMDRDYALDEVDRAFADLEAGQITRGLVRL